MGDHSGGNGGGGAFRGGEPRAFALNWQAWAVVVAWTVAAPLAVLALSWVWPWTEWPDFWQGFGSSTHGLLAFLCFVWGWISVAHIVLWRDAVELWCATGLMAIGFSFVALPIVTWADAPVRDAQFVAWALRSAGVMLLAPYTLVYLWRRKPGGELEAY